MRMMAQSPPSNAIPLRSQGLRVYRWGRRRRQLAPTILGTTRTEGKDQEFKQNAFKRTTSIEITTIGVAEKVSPIPIRQTPELK
jgi:hypothetical protein